MSVTHKRTIGKPAVGLVGARAAAFRKAVRDALAWETGNGNGRRAAAALHAAPRCSLSLAEHLRPFTAVRGRRLRARTPR